VVGGDRDPAVGRDAVGAPSELWAVGRRGS
jgi:hypothetical protein